MKMLLENGEVTYIIESHSWEDCGGGEWKEIQKYGWRIVENVCIGTREKGGNNDGWRFVVRHGDWKLGKYSLDDFQLL